MRNLIQIALNVLILGFAVVIPLYAKESTLPQPPGGTIILRVPEEVYFLTRNIGANIIYGTTSENILVLDVANNTIKKVPTWGEPRGLTLSKDGKKLYVAKATVQEIMVIDTETLKELAPIPLPYTAYDIKLAQNGMIYATFSDDYHGFMQIDPNGNSFKTVKVFPEDQYFQNGENDFDYFGIHRKSIIELSPDGKTIYFSTAPYITPTDLFKYNISNNNSLTLISLNEGDKIDNDYLRELNKHNDGYPILINQNNKISIFYRYRSGWKMTNLSFDVFKNIQFPTKGNSARLDEKDINNEMLKEIFLKTNISFNKNPYFIYSSLEYREFNTNYHNLHLTNDGEYLFYSIKRFKTKDMISQKFPLVDQYFGDHSLKAVTTSPDVKITYTYEGILNGKRSLFVWDSEQLKQLCQYELDDITDDYHEKINAIMTDNTGKKLIVATTNSLTIYATGCS